MGTVVLRCSSALVLRCLGAACLVLSAGVLRAHMATEDASAGLIAGQVMDATTGQPVATRVTVRPNEVTKVSIRR